MRRREGKYILDEVSGEIVGVAKQERFTKSMVEVWRHVIRANLFTTAEEKILHRLAMFLQMNTNALVTSGGEYMSIERMAVETSVDRAHIRRLMKSLMRKNAIGRWSSNDRDVFYINPFLFQSGDVKPWLFNLFDDECHERARVVVDLERFKAGKKQTSLIATG